MASLKAEVVDRDGACAADPAKADGRHWPDPSLADFPTGAAPGFLFATGVENSAPTLQGGRVRRDQMAVL